MTDDQLLANVLATAFLFGCVAVGFLGGLAFKNIRKPVRPHSFEPLSRPPVWTYRETTTRRESPFTDAQRTGISDALRGGEE